MKWTHRVFSVDSARIISPCMYNREPFFDIETVYANRRARLLQKLDRAHQEYSAVRDVDEGSEDAFNFRSAIAEVLRLQLRLIAEEEALDSINTLRDWVRQ